MSGYLVIDRTKGTGTMAQLTKAREFAGSGCIVKVDDNKYLCRPLKGNKDIHTLTRKKIGDFQCSRFPFICSCQFNKTGNNCSHLFALDMYLNPKKPETQIVFGEEVSV